MCASEKRKKHKIKVGNRIPIQNHANVGKYEKQ